MGFRLYREVLDHAPPDLTPAERLVLAVVADFASDTTRESFPGVDWLTHRTGLKPDSLKKVFRRLADRGIEVRVSLGEDKRGRAVYAHEGKRTTYRIPTFTRRDVPGSQRGDRRPSTEGQEQGPQSPHSDPSGGITVPKWGDHSPQVGGSSSPPWAHEPSGNPQQQRASDNERAEVLAEIRRRKPDASEGLIQHIYREDGEAILAEIRERNGRQRIAGWIAALADMPPCPHGFAGGDQLRPDTHRPQCAMCRAGRRAA